MRLTERDKAMLQFIRDRAAYRMRPATAVDVANRFPVDNQMFGRQRNASTAIAKFRKHGLVSDVSRCEHCGRALTRGKRNQPLYLTLTGMEMAR